VRADLCDEHLTSSTGAMPSLVALAPQPLDLGSHARRKLCRVRRGSDDARDLGYLMPPALGGGALRLAAARKVATKPLDLGPRLVALTLDAHERSRARVLASLVALAPQPLNLGSGLVALR
jgi:hypothetical protein